MTERAWAVIPEADKDEPERSAPPARRHSVTIATGACSSGSVGCYWCSTGSPGSAPTRCGRWWYWRSASRS